MKRLVLFSILLLAAPAIAAVPEILVLNSAATKMTGRFAARHGVFIQNNGPNDIWCGFASAEAVVNKSFRVGANGGTWSVESPLDVWCKAATADQVTGAASTVIEVP